METANRDLTEFSSHLEFFGYTIAPIDKEKHLYGAKSLTRYNLVFRPWRFGVLFNSSYGATDEAKATKELELLRFVNGCNSGFTLCRAILDKDKDVIMEAFYAFDYNKHDFGTFLEAMESEMRNAFGRADQAHLALIR